MKTFRRLLKTIRSLSRRDQTVFGRIPALRAGTALSVAIPVQALCPSADGLTAARPASGRFKNRNFRSNRFRGPIQVMNTGFRTLKEAIPDFTDGSKSELDLEIVNLQESGQIHNRHIIVIENQFDRTVFLYISGLQMQRLSIDNHVHN